MDCNEIFSLIVRHTSICFLLALIATPDMELKQLDVKTTFLYERLEEDILVQQPEGFEMHGKKNSICRLKRSFHGLKQSPRKCYKGFDEFIVSNGYSRRLYDSCVYHSKVEYGSHIYLLLYVEDMLIASQDKSEVQNLKSLLSSEFKMKDMRVAEKI